MGHLPLHFDNANKTMALIRQEAKIQRGKRTTEVRKAEVSLQAYGNLLPSISVEATAAALTAPSDLIQKVGTHQGGGDKQE